MGNPYATIEKQMIRKLLVSIVLVAAGFAGAIALMQRPRTAPDLTAAAGEVVFNSPHPAQAARPVPAPSPAPTAVTPGAPSVAGVGGPDFTRIAGQAVKGVANISSLQVVQRSNSPFANDPFFSYFFGDD